MTVWYPLGGNGGIPSTMVSSDNPDRWRLNVSSDTPFNSAGEDGRAFCCSRDITVPSGTEYSIKINVNAGYILRFVRVPNLFIEFYDGVAVGDILSINSFKPMNQNIVTAQQASAVFYDGHPSGEMIISGQDEISDSYYPNGAFSIGLSNNTGVDVSTFISIGIESISGFDEKYGLIASTELTPTTQMDQYNGSN